MPARVAIVDYGMGNLHSVELASRHVGLDAFITVSPKDVDEADAVILPGVGAFADAMKVLEAHGLVQAIKSFIAQDRPFFGICLGMQLLMSVSHEFGNHPGFDVIEGTVERFEPKAQTVKVPQVGWNQIYSPFGNRWQGTYFEGLEVGTYFYFVHSYYVVPKDPDAVLANSTYGGTSFCSAFQKGAVFATQFHPERSGPQGIKVFQRFAENLSKRVIR